PPPPRATRPAPEPRQVIMAGRLGATTSPSGTAYSAFLGVGGPTVAGKTGTAESTGKQDTSLFVGISPPDQPHYVVTAVVEEGGFGASVAAPIVARIFQGIAGHANATPVQAHPAETPDWCADVAASPHGTDRRPAAIPVRRVGAARPRPVARRRHVCDRRPRDPDDLLVDA